MPNIHEYNAPNGLGIQPTETGVDAFAQAGRRIGSFFSDMSEDERRKGSMLGGAVQSAGDAYVDYETHKEISAGAPAAANMLLGLQTTWNNTAKNSDPNNTAIGGKFREETLEPALEKFQSAFTTEKGQQWAQEQTDHIREHMYHKIVSDQSSMASQAVAVNMTQLTNTLSNAVRDDPTALDASLDMYKHSVGHIVGSSPAITPDDAVRVNEAVTQKGMQNIVWSAVQGAIEKNPDAGLKMASDPRYAKYIPGAEADRFYQEVKRQNKADETNSRILANLERTRTSEATFDAVNVALHDPEKNVTQADIRSIPPDQITPEHREQLFNINERKLNKDELKPAIVYQIGFNDTIHDMWRPVGDPEKITTQSQLQERYDKGIINYKGYKDAQRELLDPKDDNGLALQQNRSRAMQQMEPLLNPIDDAKMRHPQGYQRVDEAYARMNELEEKARAKTGDPNDVYNPSSEFYFRKDPKFQVPSPWLIDQESRQNEKASRVPDQEISPPKPGEKGETVPAPPSGYPGARWDAQRKMYTIIKDGRLIGVQ